MPEATTNPVPRIRELAETQHEDINVSNLIVLTEMTALELSLLAIKAREQVPPNTTMLVAAGTVALNRLLSTGFDEMIDDDATGLYKSVVDTAFPGVDVHRLP